MLQHVSRYWGAFILGCMAASAMGQAVVHVRADLTTGANNGTTWANAFRGRQGLASAIASVLAGSNTEIWVASGDYAPAPAGGDRHASFQMKSGVALLGGFIGNEIAAMQRDPAANITILTGDLNGNDTPNFGLTGENSLHVVRATGADATALIDGFTVRDGAALGNFVGVELSGAGLLVEGGAPRITHCRFEDCNADQAGAGAALVGATAAEVSSCLFTLNRNGHKGSGLYIAAGGTPRLQHCEFRANRGSLGAGVYSEAASPIIEDCLFLENLSDISSVAGGGLFDESGTGVMRRCDFIRNATVGGGGGIHLSGSNMLVSQCRFIANVGSFDVGDAVFVSGGAPTFVNCLMRGVAESTPTLLPHASGCIAHINGFGQPTAATFINCTLAGNRRGLFGGPAIAAVLVQPGAGADFFNCVIWDNTSGAGVGEDAAIILNSGGAATFDHCSVQGWSGMLPGIGIGAFDPIFIDSIGADGAMGTTDDDLRLGSGSACIDRGSNLLVPAGVTLDVLGANRFRNDPATANTGVGVSPIVDLGAFEFQAPPCLGDINEDGSVDFNDITAVLARWGHPFGFSAITEVLSQWGGACP